MSAQTGTGAVVAGLALVAVLAFAVLRPRGLPEATAALPAAAVVLALGLVDLPDAAVTVRRLVPTVGFLAAVLALAELARREGVFAWAGDRMAGAARGSPTRLLVAVFVVASATTAALSLDATVVLLTPAVIAAARAVGARARPGVYATTHLANTASLLLPVSNLTNLLAFDATGLTFARFAGLMALPWLAAVGVELALFQRVFRDDLGAALHRARPTSSSRPTVALAVIGATLVGFAGAEPFGIAPAWVAALAVVLLTARRLRTDPGTVRAALGATNPLFLLFVPALAVVVEGVRLGPVGRWLEQVAPTRADLLGLLAAAGLAALAANVLNNLPATLVLVPAVAQSPSLVLATLIGVNIGPNLTYVGSLATLLWRQVLHRHDQTPSTALFWRLGLLTVPAALLAATLALWAGLRIGGVR